jgi:hypothetical protein
MATSTGDPTDKSRQRRPTRLRARPYDDETAARQRRNCRLRIGLALVIGDKDEAGRNTPA